MSIGGVLLLEISLCASFLLTNLYYIRFNKAILSGGIEDMTTKIIVIIQSFNIDRITSRILKTRISSTKDEYYLNKL
ncbi:hypothetical protein BpHYR1_051625 [Brachionus plicatilis]|uniref:Uncharacterized protein n=1 Tax=Brachionus plicatilis TaxID=10195 RepID=A0A3M7QZB3_BRAPC|nr:hypothetical protein BpHYR1_051625 [Brachionus plicatilis]